MPKIKAYIRSQYVKKDGSSAVNCCFYLNREKIVIPTGISIEPKDWDELNERIKGNSKDAKDSNLIIQNVKARINNVFVRFRLENRALNKSIFLKEFSNSNNYTCFWNFMEIELNKRRGSISENTFRAQSSTLNKLKTILPELSFNDFNDESIREIKKRLKVKYDNSPNTITKNLITLKTYVSIAVRKKLMESNPFEIEKIKRFKGHQVWLNEQELVLLIGAYKKSILPKNLHKVLEYFLFSCFTGLRLSDVKNFTAEQIKGDFIIINPIKTKRTSNELVTIPLTKPIKNLIKSAGKHRLKGIVFECYADQVTNRILKKVAQSIGINKEISFHSARHTFASIFLEKTDDLASLQRLLGHTDIKQTMIYVHLTEKKKMDQMKKCWDQFLI